MEIDYNYLRTRTAIGFRASRELCSNYLFYHVSDSNCVNQSISPSRSSNCSTDSWKYHWNIAGSERSYILYQMLIVALVVPVGDDGMNPKSRPTFSLFFLRNTYVQQAAAPNSNNLRICRPY